MAPRINVAHTFGHAAAAETKGTLALLDEQGIEGELIVRDIHEDAPRSCRCKAGRSRSGAVSRPPLAL